MYAEKTGSPVIEQTTTIHAPAEEVWRSLTDPEMINGWMSDSTIHIVSEWKAGAGIVYRGDLHGIPFENKGTILRYIPPVLLEYDFWSSLSGLPDEPPNRSTITFQLTPVENNTLLSFTQRNFATDIIYRHFRFYWSVALELIRKSTVRRMHEF